MSIFHGVTCSLIKWRQLMGNQEKVKQVLNRGEIGF